MADETIGSGGDRTDISTWESNLPSSGFTEVERGQCLDQTHTVSSTINIDCGAPTATNFLELTSDDGAEHDGRSRDNTGSGAHLDVSTSNGLWIWETYSRLSWLDIDGPGNYSTGSVRYQPTNTAGSSIKIHHNIFHNDSGGDSQWLNVFISTSGSLSNIDMHIYRNIMYGCGGRNAYWGSGATADGSAYWHNTIYEMGRNDNSQTHSIQVDDSAWDVKSNAVFEPNSATTIGGSASEDHNATSDGQGDSGDSLTNLTTTSQFANATTTWANTDLLLKSGSALIDASGAPANPSTSTFPEIDESIDNRNVSISGTWDVGAHEVVAGDTTVTPGKGALTLTGKAPTVVLSLKVQPPVGSLTLTGKAPTVTVSGEVTVTPPAGSLTLTGKAPSVVLSLRLQPGVGSLTLTGKAPSVVLWLRLQPSVGSLTLTGKAPTITVTGEIAVTPGVGALTLSGKAPTVLLWLRVQPGVGTLALVGKAPTVSLTGVTTVAPGVGSLTLVGKAPAVVLWLRVQPGAGALTLTGKAPTVSISSEIVVAPGVGSLSLVGKAPAVVLWLRVTPGVGALTLIGKAPTVSLSGEIVVQPAAGAVVLAGKAPGVVLWLRVQPGVGALTLTGKAPVVVLGGILTVAPPAGALSLMGFAPSVSRTKYLDPFSIGSLEWFGAHNVESVAGPGFDVADVNVVPAVDGEPGVVVAVEGEATVN